MRALRLRDYSQVFAALALTAFSAVSTLSAATLPAGFVETQIARGISPPTAMRSPPTGGSSSVNRGKPAGNQERILLPTPFVNITVNSAGERGLLGIAFDPNFASNQYIYVYYTATTPAIHNRISRFTANGDIAVPSELAT